MRVEDIMTKEPACCSQSCTAQMAATLMRQWDCGALPVVNNIFNRRIVGIVTDRDLCLAVLPAGRDPAHFFVHEAMAHNPVCCHPEDEVGHVLELMEEHCVRRVPVVNHDNAVVGIISSSDLVRYAAISEHDLWVAMRKIYEPLGRLGREQALKKAA